ncbi:unnamed protein product [Amoebophrya sp. A25]|nr:unnamed protein product [Amoebophrya sp. A25]|eukprot:GSA25T00020215001.1
MDGELFVFSGRGAHKEVYDDLWAYDFQARKWQQFEHPYVPYLHGRAREKNGDRFLLPPPAKKMEDVVDTPEAGEAVVDINAGERNMMHGEREGETLSSSRIIHTSDHRTSREMGIEAADPLSVVTRQVPRPATGGRTGSSESEGRSQDDAPSLAEPESKTAEEATFLAQHDIKHLHKQELYPPGRFNGCHVSSSAGLFFFGGDEKFYGTGVPDPNFMSRELWHLTRKGEKNPQWERIGPLTWNFTSLADSHGHLRRNTTDLEVPVRYSVERSAPACAYDETDRVFYFVGGRPGLGKLDNTLWRIEVDRLFVEPIQKFESCVRPLEVKGACGGAPETFIVGVVPPPAQTVTTPSTGVTNPTVITAASTSPVVVPQLPVWTPVLYLHGGRSGDRYSNQLLRLEVARQKDASEHRYRWMPLNGEYMCDSQIEQPSTRESPESGGLERINTRDVVSTSESENSSRVRGREQQGREETETSSSSSSIEERRTSTKISSLQLLVEHIKVKEHQSLQLVEHIKVKEHLQGISQVEDPIPPRRNHHACVFIREHGEFWIFGGRSEHRGTGMGLLSDLYRYNVQSGKWRLEVPKSAVPGVSWPSARFLPTLEYEEANDSLIIFAGQDTKEKTNDIWRLPRAGKASTATLLQPCEYCSGEER